MPRFEVGDAATLTFEVRVAGTLTDATVMFTLTDPDGIVTTPSPTHPGTGAYAASVLFTKVGTWHYAWQATGNAYTSEAGTISVREPAILLCDIGDVELVPPGRVFTTAERPSIRASIIAVSADVIGYTGQNFVKQEYTHTFDAGGIDSIELPQRPVREVSSLTVDGTSYLAGPYGYVLHGNILGLPYGYLWGHPQMWSSVSVVYTAGYDTVPEEISDLVARTVVSRINNPEGLRQYTIGSFSATVAVESMESSGWSAKDLAILNRYARKRRAGLLRVEH